MTDREFKRLKRSELIEIIYQLQTELEETKRQLEDRNIKIQNAGSIADAAVAINRLMETAQQTADQYIESVKENAEEERKKIIEEAQKEASRIKEQSIEEGAEQETCQPDSEEK